MATIEQSLAMFSSGAKTGKIKKSTISKIFSAKVIADFSDALTNSRIRLDSVKVIFDDSGSIEEMEKKVMASAQECKTSYFDTVDSVASLALKTKGLFSSFEEVIGLQTLMMKEFRLGGTAISQQKAGMEQLIDSMSVGALTAQDMVMLLDTAPDMVQNIAEYMNAPMEKLQPLASEGLITADVVKNAMFDAAGEINDRYSDLLMTWDDTWTAMENTSVAALSPLLVAVNWLANAIGVITPLVLGLGGSFIVFLVAGRWAKIAKIATELYDVAILILTTAFGMLTGSVNAANIATSAWGGTLLASPVTWYVMAIMVLVGIFYTLVAVFNKITGSAVSATGIITGAFAMAGAFLLNRFVIPIWNKFAAFANFLLNCFRHPIASIKILFLDLAMNVIGKIRNIAHAIESLLNHIPGVNINLTSGIDKLYDGMKSKREEIAFKSGWTEYVKPKEYIDYEEAGKAGYQWGVDFKDGIAENFGLGGMDYSALLTDDAIDYKAALGASYSGQSYLEPRYDDFHLSDGTLDYLQEMIAATKGDQQITVNVDIEQNNNNQIDSRVDAVDIMSYWTREFGEKLVVAMEGVLA